MYQPDVWCRTTQKYSLYILGTFQSTSDHKHLALGWQPSLKRTLFKDQPGFLIWFISILKNIVPPIDFLVSGGFRAFP
ncbi:MAG: hypothetical protein CVU46_08545 [Chloroflexi bacterium HGW-Chloroflexi-8]|nr:MAG: hypothetical protein CVU46_08545 [Chloroflexi bacterium HGW-Chloroflexi-8]